MLRFYVLTSRKFGCLKRHFRSLPKEHTTVVINTTDKDYEQQAFQWCYDNKITAVITESNGKPGKGKNAVLDHFLESDYDYMVQIDGDDFLQPHGVNLYSWVSENNPPDGIQIVYNNSWSSIEDSWSLYAAHPWHDNFLQWVEDNIDPAEQEHYRRVYDERDKYSEEFKRHCLLSLEWNYPKDTADPLDCPRLIFYSRRLAESVRFREDLLIGEDTLLNYQVRQLAYEGSIKLKKIKDNFEKTYSYDLDNSGIVKASERSADWEWVKELNDIVEKESKEWTVTQTFVLEFVEHNIEKVSYIEDLGVKE